MISLSKQYTREELDAEVLKLAASSTAERRKVGAIVYREVEGFYKVLGVGINHNPDGGPCEDHLGETLPTVIHAEEAAINDCDGVLAGYNIAVSHPPCTDCRRLIANAGLGYQVVEAGIKFDEHKLDLTTVPPDVIRALAGMGNDDRAAWCDAITDDMIPASTLAGLTDVLRFGAHKYKKDNWKQIDDPVRYEKALYRHWLDYLSGEADDQDSKLPHLAHILTNAAFLIYFSEEDKT